MPSKWEADRTPSPQNVIAMTAYGNSLCALPTLLYYVFLIPLLPTYIEGYRKLYLSIYCFLFRLAGMGFKKHKEDITMAAKKELIVAINNYGGPPNDLPSRINDA